MPISDHTARPLANDRTGESNTVDSGCFEPFLGRLAQLRRHRTEQRNAVGRAGTRDNIEVMIAMPDDDRRPVIPAVECVARIARIPPNSSDVGFQSSIGTDETIADRSNAISPHGCFLPWTSAH